MRIIQTVTAIRENAPYKTVAAGSQPERDPRYLIRKEDTEMKKLIALMLVLCFSVAAMTAIAEEAPENTEAAAEPTYLKEKAEEAKEALKEELTAE